jgi:hypothetical protein
MQMDIDAQESDPVLPLLMAQRVACINTRYNFRSDARLRQMTVRVHKEVLARPNCQQGATSAVLIPDAQNRGAQLADGCDILVLCGRDARHTRAQGADDQELITIGEEPKGKSFSVFYATEPVPMGNLYHGPMSSHKLPAAMQPENKLAPLYRNQQMQGRRVAAAAAALALAVSGCEQSSSADKNCGSAARCDELALDFSTRRRTPRLAQSS